MNTINIDYKHLIIITTKIITFKYTNINMYMIYALQIVYKI